MVVIAADVVSYEHDKLLQHVGVGAVREVCRAGLDASGDGAVTWDVPDLKVVIAGDLAVAWGLNHVRVQPTDGRAIDTWSRGTRVFRRTSGTWLLIHLSYPYDPSTGGVDGEPIAVHWPAETSRRLDNRWPKCDPRPCMGRGGVAVGACVRRAEGGRGGVRGPAYEVSDNGRMAQPRMLYEDGRPYTVPDSLEELTGPTSGVVELPLRLDWSEQGRLHGPTLARVWRRLWLPRRVRALWESRFPTLPRAA